MKISIVTPVYNGEHYIAETITSVLSQKGDFTIEYIIIDGNSSDNTHNIISNFIRLLESRVYPIQCQDIMMSVISEKDSGMYDAINKGFSLATGDVFAWINADDIYLPGAFALINTIFNTFSEVHWAKGITSYINNYSNIYKAGKCFIYNQPWLQKGIYGKELYFIQQDSTFWRADLWKNIGGIDMSWILAGDYWLWKRFAQETPLYSTNAYISCFRKTTGQLSEKHQEYMNEVYKITPHNDRLTTLIKIFFAHEKRLPAYFRKHLFRILFGKQTFSLIFINDNSKPYMIRGSYHELNHLIEQAGL